MNQIRQSVPLIGFSNYRIGGPARFFTEAETPEALSEAVAFASEKGIPYFVMGGGTNLLINDSGFPGLVIKPSMDDLRADGEFVFSGAAVPMAKLLEFAAERGLSGLEWAGGLPGTVGGAVRGNAGAFGGEIKDVVWAIESLDTERNRQLKRDRSESFFGYRTSVFKEKKGKEIVTGAVFKLRRGEPKEIRKSMNEKIEYRKSRHPIEHPNIGSIFKNAAVEAVPKNKLISVAHAVKTDPFPVVPAAYLISESGLKGVTSGGAMVSPKHPNFIVNVLGASSDDVRSLIDLVSHEVFRKFRVRLEPEVEFVGW